MVLDVKGISETQGYKEGFRAARTGKPIDPPYDTERMDDRVLYMAGWNRSRGYSITAYMTDDEKTALSILRGTDKPKKRTNSWNLPPL